MKDVHGGRQRPTHDYRATELTDWLGRHGWMCPEGGKAPPTRSHHIDLQAPRNRTRPWWEPTRTTWSSYFDHVKSARLDC
jgi:hypothetical protein